MPNKPISDLDDAMRYLLAVACIGWLGLGYWLVMG